MFERILDHILTRKIDQNSKERDHILTTNEVSRVHMGPSISTIRYSPVTAQAQPALVFPKRTLPIITLIQRYHYDTHAGTHGALCFTSATTRRLAWCLYSSGRRRFMNYHVERVNRLTLIPIEPYHIHAYQRMLFIQMMGLLGSQTLLVTTFRYCWL